jgi:MOSC domain-containing protein YiiM
MKTLTLNDLSRTEELDAKAMAGVHGGMQKAVYPYPLVDASKYEFSLVAEQLNSQSQSIVNHNGVNAAFAEDISSKIKPTQTANNSISF